MPEDRDVSYKFPSVSTFIIETRDSRTENWKKLAEVDGSCRFFEIPKSFYGKEYFLRVYSKNDAGLSKKPFEFPEPVKFEKLKGLVNFF